MAIAMRSPASKKDGFFPRYFCMIAMYMRAAFGLDNDVNMPLIPSFSPEVSFLSDWKSIIPLREVLMLT